MVNNSSRTSLSPDAQTLLAFLGRGGTHQYYWTVQDDTKETIWFPSADPATLPAIEGRHIYFSVHPTNAAKGRHQRATIADIAALNCLFGEFDTPADVAALNPQPTVTLESSPGKFHCYWLLREPWVIDTDEKREHAKRLQRAWVSYVGSDPNAKDLARVLRVPDTYNVKPEYGPEYPLAHITEADYTRLYTLAELEPYCASFMPTEQGDRAAIPDTTYVMPHHNAYVQAAVAKELQALQTAQNGERNAQLNTSAFALGRFIGSGLLDRFDIEQALYETACATGLDRDDGGPRGIRATIRSGIEAGIREPRGVPERPTDSRRFVRPAHTSPNGAHAADDSIPPVTAGEKLPQLPVRVVTDCLHQNEAGDALLLEQLYETEHGYRIRYDHGRKVWFLWNGHSFVEDRTNAMKRIVSGQLAAQYLHAAADLKREGEAERDLMSENGGAKLVAAKNMQERAGALRNANRINNVLSLASSEPLGVTGDEWDSDAMLLGVKNGVIDLRTGELRPGRPSDMIRTTAPTEYRGLDEPAPRFKRFFEEIFENAPERDALIAYLQRLFGYGITGRSTEHKLPILYGELGRNGKDTLLEALGGVLGPYVGAVNKDVLVAPDSRSAGGAQPHLMDLQGKRIVWANETNEGARLNSGQVKFVTGGGAIRARPLYGKPISFQPTHLLLLLTNNRPHAPSDDQALWSRINLIPFNMRFVDDPKAPNERKVDRALWEALRQEASGILAWLVRGCLMYQQEGLNPPAIVQLATKQYQEDEDTLGQFLDEHYIEHPNATLRAGAAYDTYKVWAEAMNIKPLNGQTFKEKMMKRYVRAKKEYGFVYIGIGLQGDLQGSPPTLQDRNTASQSPETDASQPCPAYPAREMRKLCLEDTSCIQSYDISPAAPAGSAPNGAGLPHPNQLKRDPAYPAASPAGSNGQADDVDAILQRGVDIAEGGAR